MAKTQHEPFDFTDLIEEKSEPQTSPESTNAGDPPLVDASNVDVARAEGVNEGEQKALDSLAAAEAEALRSIAAILASKEFNFAEAIDREKFAIRESAGAFLEQFCAGVLREREIELAETLLCQLLSASEDRSRAKLFLNPDSAVRLEDRLDALLDKHGVRDFLTYEGDPALSRGECRIEWHGGAIRRTNAEIKQAMADIFGVKNSTIAAPAAEPAKTGNTEPSS